MKYLGLFVKLEGNIDFLGGRSIKFYVRSFNTYRRVFRYNSKGNVKLR